MKKTLLYCLSVVASIIVSPGFALGNNPTTQPNDCIRYINNHVIKAPPMVFLDLSGCRLQDNNMPDILTYLSNNPSINALLLDSNNIGPDGAKMLADKIKIDFIGLDDNHVGSEGAKSLATNLSIAGLTLSNNYMDTDGALALAKSQTLKMLNVSNNNITSEGTTALANNSKIQSLSIGGNQVDATTVFAITNNKTLKELDVSYTTLNSNDIVAILNALPKLTSLGIDGLHLGDQITPALAKKTSLEFLDITENDLSPKGATALTPLIGENFLDLDISHNLIGNEGAAALAKGQAYMLAFLWMADNNISDDGALALANTTMAISDLNVSHNHISQKGIMALKNNPVISYVNADYNTPQNNVAVNTKAIQSQCNDRLSFACINYLKKINVNKK